MKIYLCLCFILLCGTLESKAPPEPATTKVAVKDGEKGPPSKDSDVCLTTGCVLAAAEVLKKINLTADPCNNFYEFACGNFLKETVIPDDKTDVNIFDTIQDKVSEQLRLILEEPSKDDEVRPIRMSKDLYKSCMNKAKIEENGLNYIKETLKELGGWPVLDNSWDESKFTWKSTIYKFKEKGFSIDYLNDFSVQPDFNDPEKRVIQLDQPSLSLDKNYLDKGMEEKLVKALYNYMVDVAVMFGADPERAKKELKESLDFEIKLAKISKLPEDRRDFSRMNNRKTIPELITEYPSIPWDEYISEILPKRVNVQHDELVIINERDYIRDLGELLSNVPKRTVANYMFSRAVGSMVPYLTENLRAAEQKYDTVISGRSERPPRWKECVEIVSESLPWAVGSFYVKHFFEREAKTNLLEVVKNIRAEMEDILQHVGWMDERTRTNAKEKALAMLAHIAYSDDLLVDKKLTDFYQKLENFEPENYMKAFLDLNRFDLDFNLGRLREPVDKSDWTTKMSPAIVNAWYQPSDNSIEFPAAILQEAIFSHDRPNYMNYGAIGSVIGHEITHGFDDEGKQFDKDGKLSNWWDPETQEAFKQKAMCIVDQYKNYVAEQVDKNLNGENTQGENIADNGGIKLAYRAYNRWVEKHKTTEKRLPGLQNFTPQQMFWISNANVWCTKYRPEALKDWIVTDEHSPGEFRVRGPFSNRPEFAKDFGCPPGSKMNPTKKCEVW